jgi:hypothetical protein
MMGRHVPVLIRYKTAERFRARHNWPSWYVVTAEHVERWSTSGIELPNPIVCAMIWPPRR